MTALALSIQMHTYKCKYKFVEIVQKFCSFVINEPLGHSFVAEELVGEVFLHLKRYGAGLEL